MKNIPVFLIFIFLQVNLIAQPADKQKKNNIANDKVLYTVGYAHLDTEWLWDYPSTISEYIKNTMEENFLLFEKYPDYVFNFTGSRRYNMMKEYYPAMYQQVKEYIKKKRWNVSGSSVDEGEVNISSSESLIRQVLYGNEFFQKEFGVVSQDYMLPDCFGFLANTPSIWNHCGLLGFSTQKLTWNAAVDLPFNVGIWNGPDGKGVIAALNATDYGGQVGIRLDKDSLWNARMENNFKKYGFYFDYRYYGVGDQGGAPREDDVRHAVGSLNNSDSKIKVVLSASDQMYKDITPELRKKLPAYSGDLLLIEHSAGSLTSEAYMKRINRKNENLAQSAEQMSSVATVLMGAEYPMTKLNNSWDLVLGSQFHDILPGTSIPVAYEYAWNDEFIAANGFSESLKNALGNISAGLNTIVKGRSVTVYNPVAANREDVAVAELEYSVLPSNIKVIASNGKEVPSQILSSNGNKLKFIFLARVPSLGMSVFDVQEAEGKTLSKSVLSVSSNSLDNTFYKITLDNHGDIKSIYDKKLKKEILLKPARLEFLHEKPSYWSAWNMDWNDRKNPPIDYLDGNVSIKVLEQGPVRVALQVTREKRNSEITQIISLSTGEAGKRLEITNKLDWQSTGVSLKASFPLVAENENATYNLGVGAIQRSNNNSKKFEVPSKEWFDLTDKSGKFGVSVLEDCKYGSDKPDNNTLRLTLLYTPEAHKDFIHQGSQDWGIHDIKYGLYCHSGNWTEGETQWQAEFLNKPLVAFESPVHTGSLGKSVSFLSFNNPKIGLMAFKKSENGDYFIVRMNELTGSDQKGIKVKFNAKIEDAYEVNGQEQKTGDAFFSGNTLDFDISHFTIRSFAVKFQPKTNMVINEMPVALPYNKDVISFDRNRADGSFSDGESYPAELFPDELTSEGIVFKLGSTEDEENNVTNCNGQTIALPEGTFNKVYLLAAATEDVKTDFEINSKKINLAIQDKSGFVGQFYNRVFSAGWKDVLEVKAPFVMKSNIAWYASHLHNGYPSKNEAYKYAYMFKYEIDLPDNATYIKLPDNKKIMIFAITVANSKCDNIELAQSLSDDFNENKSYSLRSEK
jgi:alpha-mannosidase